MSGDGADSINRLTLQTRRNYEREILPSRNRSHVGGSSDDAQLVGSCVSEKAHRVSELVEVPKNKAVTDSGLDILASGPGVVVKASRPSLRAADKNHGALCQAHCHEQHNYRETC